MFLIFISWVGWSLGRGFSFARPTSVPPLSIPCPCPRPRHDARDPLKKSFFSLCCVFFYVKAIFVLGPNPNTAQSPASGPGPKETSQRSMQSIHTYIYIYIGICMCTYVYVCRLSFAVASKQLTRQANRKPQRVFYLPFGHFSAHNY